MKEALEIKESTQQELRKSLENSVSELQLTKDEFNKAVVSLETT